MHSELARINRLKLCVSVKGEKEDLKKNNKQKTQCVFVATMTLIIEHPLVFMYN